MRYRIENISNGPLYVPRGFEVRACLEQGAPHIWGGFENSVGKHFLPGYGVSCGFTPSATPPTVAERMNKAAVLLHPGEHLDGTLQLTPAMFSLPPGAYRIEATLTGWSDDKFTDAERMDLAKMGSPFLRGEVPASIRITLLQRDSAQRNFQKALRQLMDLRAKRAAEPGQALPNRDCKGAAVETPAIADKPLNPKLVSFLQNDSEPQIAPAEPVNTRSETAKKEDDPPIAA